MRPRAAGLRPVGLRAAAAMLVALMSLALASCGRAPNSAQQPAPPAEPHTSQPTGHQTAQQSGTTSSAQTGQETAQQADPQQGGRGEGEREASEDAPRIVAFSPAIAALLADMGLAQHVVARHDHDLVLPPDLPSAGHQEQIDYEALLRVRPTHVLLQWGERPLPRRLTELAEAYGWDVMNLRLLSIEDVASEPVRLHAKFARWLPEDYGTERTPELRLLDAIRRRGDGFASVGPVLLLAAVEPYGAAGPGSFHHEILVRLGGEPAVREGAAWVELDAEDVLRLSPAGIVLVSPRAVGAEPARLDAEGVRKRLGVVGRLDVPAVRDGRLALIDDPLSHLPATTLVGFAEELAATLERWRAAAE